MSSDGRAELSSVTAEDLLEVRRGLRMAHPPDPDVLERERAELRRLDGEPLLPRLRGFARMIGPGYLQSAMTLGGGTATAALFSGALFGYELLWVAPLAMALGVLMLAAISHQDALHRRSSLRRHAPLRRCSAGVGLGARCPGRFDHLALSPVRAGVLRAGRHLGRARTRAAAPCGHGVSGARVGGGAVHALRLGPYGARVREGAPLHGVGDRGRHAARGPADRDLGLARTARGPAAGDSGRAQRRRRRHPGAQRPLGRGRHQHGVSLPVLAAGPWLGT